MEFQNRVRTKVSSKYKMGGCHITHSKRPGMEALKLHISQRGVQPTHKLASLREFVKMQNFEPYPRNTHLGYGTISSTLLSSLFFWVCILCVACICVCACMRGMCPRVHVEARGHCQGSFSNIPHRRVSCGVPHWAQSLLFKIDWQSSKPQKPSCFCLVWQSKTVQRFLHLVFLLRPLQI